MNIFPCGRLFLKQTYIKHNPFKRTFSSTSIVLHTENKAPNESSLLPSFNDHKLAYQYKTAFELLRAIFILKLCSFDYVVNNSLALLERSHTLFGSTIFGKLMRPTIYGHFVGGETWKEVKECVDSWRKKEMVGSMLVASLEEDVTEIDTCNLREDQYEKNTEVIINCLHIIKSFDQPVKKMQLKLTGIISPNLVMKLGPLYDGCNINHKVSYIKYVASVMCGEVYPDRDAAGCVESSLSEQELQHLNHSLKRLQRICKEAKHCDVYIYVDAEWTYINEGVRWITNAMVYLHNTRGRSYIRNTYQCYLKQTPERLSTDLDLILCHLDRSFGCKLVRGAYILQEVDYAASHNHPSPVHDSYEATSGCYNGMVNLLLDKIRDTATAVGCKETVSVMIATHNRESVEEACVRLSDLKLNELVKGEPVCFAQIMGRSDHITSILGHCGYPVYKSIPYGAVPDTLAYLARRAVENRSVLDERYVREERRMMWAEVRRRVGLPEP